MKGSRGTSRSSSNVLRQDQAGKRVPGLRPWAVSLTWAVVVLAAGITLSATVNPLIGRRVHWDWTGAVGVGLFLLAAVAIRRRWV
jgi:hypothetical protein